ncbi:MAG: alanyl-tRNA editing protein [Gemmatimonadales bacterium]
MTERLYFRDARLLEFDANVVDHAGDDRHVVLDRTAFYPTSGGQPHDTGVLGGARVTDVIDEDERIVHVLDRPLAAGAVHGSVDADRRRDHMQQHSAQHVLSAIAQDRLGWDTASVHFGDEHSSIEFAVANATDKQLADLERWANDVVREAREVTVGFEDSGMAARIGLRKPSPRTGEIRVIAIADVDRSACGGTHVSRTSEIGSIRLMGMEKMRNHLRVAFLAGDRVLAHAKASEALLSELARDLNCAVGELAALVPARQLEIKRLRDRTAELEQELAIRQLGELAGITARGADGLRRIRHRSAEAPAAMMRAMMQAVVPLDHVLLVATTSAPPTVYVVTSADSGIDAGALLKAELGKIGGRGGGSARAAQGTAPSDTAVEQVAAVILDARRPE